LSFLRDEIHEQPQALARLLDRELGNAQRIATELRTRAVRYAIIAARGTSDNAARYGQYLLGAYNRLPVGLATPSLFSVYRQPPLLDHGLVIGISQSGQSPDIVAVLEEGQRQGVPTVAITNDTNSPLSAQAEFVVPLHAGQERAVAATKTYTCQLAALALLSCSLAGDASRLEVLLQVPQFVERVLKKEDETALEAERCQYMERCVVLGRGYNYATACEIALKLRELASIDADPFSSADFMHGPIASLRGGFLAIVVAPSGKMFKAMQDFGQELRSRDADLLIISDRKDMLARAEIPLSLPEGIPEWLSPLVAVVPGQLLALHLAQIKGYDPDQVHGLQKITLTQ